MGTVYEYTFRFEGDAKVLARVRKMIARLQKESAEYSGNGNCSFDMKPQDIPGGIEWWCFAKGGIDDFVEDVERFIEGKKIRAHIYTQTTDGRLWCSLRVLDGPDPYDEDAFSFEFEFDEGGLGLDAAMAYWRGEIGEATDADVAALLDRFKGAKRDAGWRGDVESDYIDVEHLMTAAACARGLGLAIERAPAGSLAWEPIEALEGDIRAVCSALFKQPNVTAYERRGIDALLALLDERKFSKAAPMKAGAGKASSGKGTKGKKAAGKGTKASGPTL